MTQEILYQFSGPLLVRQIGYDRGGFQPRLVLTIVASEGNARLLFTNPEPEVELFAVLQADELWVYSERTGGAGGRIQVDFWIDGYHHFEADHVEDLDAVEETVPDDPDAAYRTGPIPQV